MRLVLLSLIAGMLYAGVAEAQTVVTVTIEGVRADEGTIRVALFDNRKDFLKKAAYTAARDVTSETVLVSFPAVTPGKYGISAFHDRDGNGELSTNGLGIPTEGFGFGNDAMGIFGPPSFDRASVEVQGDTMVVRLRLRHF